MRKNDWKKIFRSLVLLTEVGLLMVINIGLGFFLGFLIDRILQLELIFKISGLILGISSGFYSVYHLIKKNM